MDTSPIVMDIETCGHPSADDFLDPVLPAKNLVDPAKVAADIEKRIAERADKLALDPNVGRIVALGYWTEETGIDVLLCRDETQEAAALAEFWQASKHRTIVGFHCKGFDLRFLVRRSQLLGVAYPQLDFGKYSRKGITDLFLDLTFGDGTYDQGCMKRTLKAFAKRFGIPVDDAIAGKEIPALVAAGQWQDVYDHCQSDVALTVALARRVGVVRSEVGVLF